MNPSISVEDSALLWKYIDGLCTPQEAEQVAARLKKEAPLKAEWLLRLQLNNALHQLPMEQPSMRFAMNVLDRLPVFMRKITVVKPLISTHWLKAFWTAMGATACTLIAMFSSGDAVRISSSSPIEHHVNAYTEFLQQLPYSYLLASMAIAFGLLALHILERRLSQSLARKTK